MTSEQLDERLDGLSTKSKDEWTPEDYLAVFEAYEQAGQTTKDQAWAILCRSKGRDEREQMGAVVRLEFRKRSSNKDNGEEPFITTARGICAPHHRRYEKPLHSRTSENS